ncbi:deoxyguanosinetriphosphate triphosphohydrolase [Massilia antarctica]|uniref:deoxyguanosinetriphosphate triphosphohydrolase n=1 Tax=Massilia antarctica TaxID=2765360 RepID=UPI0006BB97C3|nr:deoxyguanosinetriphosphate triphosphohydrolase [Massilia sp. H27-R4]MCY0911693.1 deoxyguanosinetriphosphate triphosphohydrolase [Massilia sp. H27-R4]CUI06857.1 Deoxyguanosinetriphosphate triphosphohydrolase [Janthinobacterium sp. CG23_2]CUU30643.1 Deoxyguanosinetriphosphate triphosphohydrolase [Janthinobacterium sp. CG23_2]
MHPEEHLAPYAVHSETARGRRHAETSHASRSQFQRDRDRIIHCSAFRRLEYKTQVFLNHEGDMFRTRLTHSLEVAQVGRSMARNLRLNEDLVEALALAHDLGHTPFGHVGQDVLNECMQDHGGFEHNLQSLRVVDELEEHYGAFDGLNLMFDTREGILKHCSLTNAKLLGPVAQRFIDRTEPSLEAQLTNLADEIAYNSHDIDDGLRSGLITIAQLEEVDFFARRWHDVQKAYPGLSGRRAIYETLRRLITVLADDLIETSSVLLAEAAPADTDAVRTSGPLIRFSDPMRKDATELKRFLRANLYRHFKVNRMRVKASRIVRELFDAFMAEPVLLPPDYQVGAGDAAGNPSRQARKIADYIAGMTDRYAIREHRRIFSLDDL